MELRLIVGLVLSVGIAEAAYRKRSLSRDGMLAACVVGSMIYTFGSLYWYGLLLSFFVSSSLWSKYKKNQKRKVEDLFAKTGRRDAWQVVANGGLGLFAVIANFFHPSIGWMLVYLGILSTVNADTWGTEIGVLSKAKPVHILTWKRVEKGTSGGLSGLGTIGTISGALFMGICASIFNFIEHHTYQLFFLQASLLGGVVGAMADSLLGATIQNMYCCVHCKQQTEKPTHCGMQTQKIRGLKLINNDVVNLLSSLVGGAISWYIFT